ncbi:MAG: tetratricopeptide repeat protein [Gammaproteobacteria bacterium]|nr:tetratricopeptide repeat protein [Gammaproteobacteria bacterium]
MNMRHRDTRNESTRLNNFKSSFTRNKLKKLTKSPETLNILAKKLFKNKKMEEAINAVNAAIHLAPHFAEAYHTKAKIYFAQRRFEEAAEAAETAVSLAPTYAEAYHTLAQSLNAKGDAESAIPKLRSAITLAPEYAEAYFTLGNIFYSLKHLEAAIVTFKDAITIKSDYVEAMNMLGIILQETGELEEAEAILKRATTLKPDYANALNTLGFVLRQMGREEEAAETFKNAYDLFNPHLVIHPSTSNVTRILRLTKRYIKASADLMRFGMTGKANSKTFVNYQLLSQSTNSKISDHFSKILEKLPGNSKILPQWKRSSIFPWVTPEDMPKILNKLNQDGLYIFDQVLDNKLLDEILCYAKTAEAFLVSPVGTSEVRGVFDPQRPLASGYQFEECHLLQQSVFQQFLADPLVLAIAQAYLGVLPKFRDLNLWWSTAISRNPSCHLAQLFHNDLSHIKWLKIFIYITDVTKESGAHSFVRGSHKPNAKSKDLRNRGVVRICDEDIYKSYGKENVIDILGPKGTIFIEDTRGFHKGHNPTTDHRLVLEMYLVNSLYPDGKKKWKLIPSNQVFSEALQAHPKVYAGYNI